jgi:hypothetical protein
LSQSSHLKKRRFRELNNCWNLEDGDSETLLAVCDEEARSTKSSSNKRRIKLQKKLLNKVCFEVDSNSK